MITLALGDFQSNCYILNEDGFAFVIDPGGEPAKILEILRENKVKRIKIVNTHAHVDHWMGNSFLKKNLVTEIFIGENEKKTCSSPTANLSSLAGGLEFPPPDGWLADGQVLKEKNFSLEVINTPGHTPGGISLRFSGGIFTGDSLFAGSLGRCDLPGGDEKTLLNSIKTRLLVFPDETKIFPGHGPVSTIGTEKRTNPFLK